MRLKDAAFTINTGGKWSWSVETPYPPIGALESRHTQEACLGARGPGGGQTLANRCPVQYYIVPAQSSPVLDERPVREGPGLPAVAHSAISLRRGRFECAWAASACTHVCLPSSHCLCVRVAHARAHAIGSPHATTPFGAPG